MYEELGVAVQTLGKWILYLRFYIYKLKMEWRNLLLLWCNEYDVIIYIFRRLDKLFLEPKNDLIPFERQEGTMAKQELIFDQHAAYLSSLPASTWLLPLGVLAVGLKNREPIIEYTDLIAGLLSNILQSVLGNLYFWKCFM